MRNDSFCHEIFQDWEVNRRNRRVQVGLLLFRIAQHVRRQHGRMHPLSALSAVLYRCYSEIVGSFELPVSTAAGPRLMLWHGFGLVVNRGTVIGSDVTLRQSVTIGNNGRSDACPVIGDRVDIGAGAMIVGPVRIGDGASIGAHALVTKDVPAGARVRAPRSEILGVDRQDGGPSVVE